MAKWILLNKVIVGGPGFGPATHLTPGTTIDDTQQSTSLIATAGGILWPATDPVMVAVAANANAQKLRGQATDAELAALLLSGAFYALSGGSSGALLGPTGAEGDPTAPFVGVIQKRSATIGFAQFAAAVTNTFNIGAILPANAVIVSREVRVATEFTGGGLSSMTLSLGIATRTTDIVNAQDVYGTQGNLPGTTGIDPNALYATASQLIATFTGSAADAPTAGSLVADVRFCVLP